MCVYVLFLSVSSGVVLDKLFGFVEFFFVYLLWCGKEDNNNFKISNNN